MKVLLAGGTGLLGARLASYLRGKGYNVVVHGRERQADFKADLTNKKSCYSLLNSTRPDFVINLVALTSVEKCEAIPDYAFKLNCRVSENLSDWCHENSIKQLYISTDHLYDGVGENCESDVVITNQYAVTKYAGELAAMRAESTILRTNFVGKSDTEGRESLSDWVYKAASLNTQVQVLCDVFFSPMSIYSLCAAIETVLLKPKSGVYNVGCKGFLSKSEFDFRLARIWGFECSNMRAIKSRNATFLTASRPSGMAMNSSKFETDFNYKLPTIDQVINEVSEEYI